MATKRVNDGTEQDPKKPDEKRMRRYPSFATVIRQVMMDRNMQKQQNLFMAIETLLRTVVQEELERILLQRTSLNLWSCPSQKEEKESSSLQLIFQKQLSLPIYTGNKIESVDGNPLQILLIDRKNNVQTHPFTLPSPLKLELVVIDGCFPPEGQENWTSLEFDKHIVKGRDGKRPLIIGELNLTMKDNCCCSISEPIITDNSSWIKSRHFRIGVRVLGRSYEGPRIQEAMTERFVVKDKRGESYEKHYPPSLTDEVWRLKNIRKDGKLHTRLTDESIITVQDFLRLLYVDFSRLRKILGMGPRPWEVTVTHARTCSLGQKTYLYRGSQFNILLSPICELKGIVVDNYLFTPQQLDKSQRDFLVREAYEHWNMVEENVDAFVNIQSVENLDMAQQIQQWYSEPQQNTSLQFEIADFDEIEGTPNNLQRGYIPD